MRPFLFHLELKSFICRMGRECIRVVTTEATSSSSSDQRPLSPVWSPAPWIHWPSSFTALWHITGFSGEWKRRKRKAKWHAKMSLTGLCKLTNKTKSWISLPHPLPKKKRNLLWISCSSREKPLISEPKLFVYCLSVLSPSELITQTIAKANKRQAIVLLYLYS